MTPYPFSVIGIHDSLRCRTDRDSLFERAFACVCDPCYLSCKAFDVCLLSLEDFFRHEQGKSAVFDTNALYSFVEPPLYFFPDEVRGGL